MINDYEALANNGMSNDRLASTFFKEYFKNSTPTFPINPFQMLKNIGAISRFLAIRNGIIRWH